MIFAASEGQNKILKAGVSMNVKYFAVSQDVKVSEVYLSHPSVPRRAERVLCGSCFREILMSHIYCLLWHLFTSRFMGS